MGNTINAHPATKYSSILHKNTSSSSLDYFHSLKNPNSLSIFSYPCISKSPGSSKCTFLCPTKPGLAIINSLFHESKTFEDQTLIDSPKYYYKNSTSTVFVPQFKINVPKSLTLYNCTKITNPNNLCTPKEIIKMSEEYTRVTFRGPKIGTTHIFGDCVLECHPNEFVDSGIINNNGEIIATKVLYQVVSGHDSWASTSTSTSNFETGFLKTCYMCNKSLEGDDDIYIYRGDASFCSKECRFEQIMADKHHELMRKKMEASSRKMNNNGISSNHQVIFLVGDMALSGM